MSEKVKLESINFGLLAEAFSRELAKVAANVADLSTQATATREITLRIKIKPWEDRSTAKVELSCESKLAPEVAQNTVFFFEHTKAGVQVYESNHRQGSLPFDDTEKEESGIIVMKKESKSGK